VPAPVIASMKPDVEVVIVGAGFAGIGMASALLADKRSSFVVLERGSEVGGTWRDNTYPGCACDVPSHLYSFSFAQNPNWSHIYATQAEIHSYLKDVAKQQGVLPFVRFGKALARGRFDEHAGLWHLELADSERLTCRVLISGAGSFSVPKLPSIAGIERFAGPIFHSARWQHDQPLDGTRVAVIGTGASAIQFIPEIAPRVAQLYVFQRSAPWVFPRRDRAMHPAERAAFARLPVLQKLLRGYIFFRLELLGLGLVRGRMDAAERIARQHIADQISDPELRAKVTPDYAPGCKRLLISNDYYPALARPNVELVTTAIDHITETSVVTTDGRERAVDRLILGTGFDVHRAPFDLTGLGGRRLRDDWSGGEEAYLTVAASGYPNLFFLTGPNSGTGHNSVVYTIETQVRHVMRILRLMDRESIAWLHPTEAAQRAFNDKLERRLARSVWATGGCQSWYRNANGRLSALWPGLLVEYRKALAGFDRSAYETRARSSVRESGQHSVPPDS
jgi:cation diffusion facilitator CzcD-associated flavoprotein CzcO